MRRLVNRIAHYKVGTTIVLSFLSLIWFLPTLSLLVTTFRSKDSVAQTGWWEAILNPLNQQWTLDAFAYVASGSQKRNGMWDALLNTFIVTVPATVLPILIAANAAFAFTFLQFKGREVMFSVLIGLLVIPLQSALVPVLRGLRWIKENIGLDLLGNFPSAWLVHSAFALPLAIYILRNYMMTLPTALIEAARIDGATYYQIFWRLIMPMSMPALASFAIFQFLWVWNDYLIAFIFVGQEHPVMTYNMLLLLGQFGDGWQNVAAASVISLIVPLIVFFSMQRYFVRGLTAGSVK